MGVSYDKSADVVYIEFSIADIEIINTSVSPLKALTKQKVLLAGNR